MLSPNDLKHLRTELGALLRADGFSEFDKDVVRRSNATWNQEMHFSTYPGEARFFNIDHTLEAVGGPRRTYCVALYVPPNILTDVYLHRVRPYCMEVEAAFDAATPEDIPMQGRWGNTMFVGRNAMAFAAELRWSQGRHKEAEAFCMRALLGPKSPATVWLAARLERLRAGAAYPQE